MKKYSLPGMQDGIILGSSNIDSLNILNRVLTIWSFVNYRAHHVVFIYLWRLLPTLAMRIIEARAIQGLGTKVRYIIDNLFV